jgi:Arc/MetJ-type ribon-helix-helix transcriptional regulator
LPKNKADRIACLTLFAKLRRSRCSAIVPDKEIFMRTVILELPDDLAEMIDDKAKQHGYLSSADVIRDGLMELHQRDADLDRPEIDCWIQEQVIPTYANILAGREKLLTAEEVWENLEARFRTL